MGLLKDPYVTEFDFDKFNSESTDLFEYIDGQVYALASPSTAHQRVSLKLSNIFFNYLDGHSCEVFVAPFDIKLTKEDLAASVVIPDLSIICDKEGLNDKRYEGVPSLIIEILSPSNQHQDLVVKMNLYAKYGVKEYWIVNPMTRGVIIYSLDSEQHYTQFAIKSTGTVESKLFSGLSVDLDKLFQN